MSHFSKSAIESDPEGLVRLRSLLQARTGRCRTGETSSSAAKAGRSVSPVPSIQERFGVAATDRPVLSIQPRLVPEDAASN